MRTFMNQLKEVIDDYGGSYNQLSRALAAEYRLGNSHMKIPGHDGKFGYGGSCFPKDVQALIQFGKDKDIDLAVVKGSWKTNLKVRPEKDWEKLIGRAIMESED